MISLSVPCRLVRSSHYLVSFEKRRDRLKLSEINSLRLSIIAMTLSAEQIAQNSWGWYRVLKAIKLLTILPLVLDINIVVEAHVAVSARKFIILMEAVQHVILVQMMMSKGTRLQWFSWDSPLYIWRKRSTWILCSLFDISKTLFFTLHTLFSHHNDCATRNHFYNRLQVSTSLSQPGSLILGTYHFIFTIFASVWFDIL